MASSREVKSQKKCHRDLEECELGTGQERCGVFQADGKPKMETEGKKSVGQVERRMAF